jgi:hypothetical protein
MDEKQFANICRASDRYVEKKHQQGEKKPFMFIEILETHNHETEIWQTTKVV